MHTDGTAVTNTENMIKLQVQFFAVDVTDLTDIAYYLTAGVEYGDQSYVWVGQAPITVAKAVRVRSKLMTLFWKGAETAKLVL